MRYGGFCEFAVCEMLAWASLVACCLVVAWRCCGPGGPAAGAQRGWRAQPHGTCTYARSVRPCRGLLAAVYPCIYVYNLSTERCPSRISLACLAPPRVSRKQHVMSHGEHLLDEPAAVQRRPPLLDQREAVELLLCGSILPGSTKNSTATRSLPRPLIVTSASRPRLHIRRHWPQLITPPLSVLGGGSFGSVRPRVAALLESISGGLANCHHNRGHVAARHCPREDVHLSAKLKGGAAKEADEGGGTGRIPESG